MIGMTKVTDFLILNLLFIIFCIPVFTLGAAVSALYSVIFKELKNEDVYVFKNFWQAFKVNFKQGTLVWVVFLFILVAVNIDFKIIQQGNIYGKSFLLLILLIIDVLLFVGLLYVFPYIAKFKNTFKRTIVNAIVIGVASFPSTAMIVVFLAFCIFILVKFSVMGAIALFFFGFSGISYFTAKIFNKVFAKYY